jgi:hypothetical protein
MSSLKIIDNKRMEMTKEEYDLYLRICNSYPQGKDLFRGLFETSKDGVIVFLIPPEKEFSMEVVIFLQNLMVQQNLRKVYREHDESIKEYKSCIKDLQKTVDNLAKDISDLKSSSSTK